MWPIIVWWGILEILGVAALPLCFARFSREAGHGYAFARVVALLLLTYLSWLAGYVLPMPIAVVGTLGALLVVGAATAWHQRSAIGTYLQSGSWKTWVRHDLLWTAGFLFFVWQRAMSPDVFGAEKYMDFAFLNVLSRTDSMPPPDPWMSGKTLNYYYFGYLMFADLVRIAPLPAHVSYNLCVATIGGLAFSQTAAIVLHLTHRWGLAVLGGTMSVVLGNLDGFLQWLERGRLTGMDVWRSSRVVGRFLDPAGRDATTINEFPFFSTIHGDLHPHFMVFPVSILLIAILLDEGRSPFQKNRQFARYYPLWLSDLIVSFVLGAMIAISNWELPIGILLVALLAGRRQPLLPLFTKARGVLLGRLVFVFVMARYAWFLPSYLGIDLAPGGVGIRVAHSSLAEFVTVFGLLLFPPTVLVWKRCLGSLGGSVEVRELIIAAGVLAIIVAAMVGNAVLPLLAMLLTSTLWIAYARGDVRDRAGYLLIGAALAALLACEVVYIKDAYGERLYRMNTVFKLYFQAWTILAVGGPWALHRLLSETWRRPWMRGTTVAAFVAVAAASACYPLGVTLDRWGASRWTLDGNAYLAREHPDDFAAITWLRRNVSGTPVILEASGNPYSYFARFSSNTGLPTVMGWANHEGLWRAHEPEVAIRHNQVQQIYSAATLAEVQPLLEHYNVRYILVGEIERRLYPAAGLQKFSGLPKLYETGGTVVYGVEGRGERGQGTGGR